jgi:hypothetical protein
MADCDNTDEQGVITTASDIYAVGCIALEVRLHCSFDDTRNLTLSCPFTAYLVAIPSVTLCRIWNGRAGAHGYGYSQGNPTYQRYSRGWNPTPPYQATLKDAQVVLEQGPQVAPIVQSTTRVHVGSQSYYNSIARGRLCFNFVLSSLRNLAESGHASPYSRRPISELSSAPISE